eukprot:gene19499-8725_t
MALRTTSAPAGTCIVPLNFANAPYLVIKGAVCKITAITSQGGVSLTQKIGESEFPITIKFTGEYSSGVQVTMTKSSLDDVLVPFVKHNSLLVNALFEAMNTESTDKYDDKISKYDFIDWMKEHKP